MRADALESCKRQMGWPASSNADRPIIFSFATSIPKVWYLGLSAARLGLPIAVSGLGRPNSGFNWWLGYARKLPAARRGAQMVHALAPDRAVIWADATDTAIVNTLQSAAPLLERARASPNEVLIGAECFSWPVCYTTDYLATEAGRACAARSPTCYANSGLYLASSRAMERWFDAAVWTWQSLLGTPISNAQCMNDQAVLHHVYLNRSLQRYSQLAPRLDETGRFFVALNPCVGKSVTRLYNLVTCFQRRHVALDHLFWSNATPAPRPRLERRVARVGGARQRKAELTHERELWYSATDVAPDLRPDPLSRAVGPGSGHVRPFMVHANAQHGLLLEDSFFAGLRATLTADPTLLDYPVLLVDSKQHGPCAVVPMRALWNLSTPQRRPSTPEPRRKRKAGTARGSRLDHA